MATINDLSDAILCDILSHINIDERERLELVCKRWRTLNRVLWGKIIKLEFQGDCNDGTFSPKVRRSTLDELEVEAGNPSDIAALLKKCESSLRVLIIVYEGLDGDRTDELKALRKCKNLESFYIETYDKNLMTDCLYNMPTESLEELHVINVQEEFTDEMKTIIEEIMMQAEQLTSLTLSSVSSMGLEIIGTKSRLKSFHLGNTSSSLEKDQLCLDFTNLTNLELLTIHEERMVDDDLLLQIAENCEELRFVDLWTENSIDEGLKALGTLPNLCTVDLMMPSGEIEILNFFSNLKEFRCELKGESSVDEEILTDFLQRSPNLKKYFFNHHRYNELFGEIVKKAGKEIRCTRH